jgi:hypothetical protein
MAYSDGACSSLGLSSLLFQSGLVQILLSFMLILLIHICGDVDAISQTHKRLSSNNILLSNFYPKF